MQVEIGSLYVHVQHHQLCEDLILQHADVLVGSKFDVLIAC